MIYIGYALYIAVFIVFGFFEPARDFIVSSYNLAPEITALVMGFYVYTLLLTIFLTFRTQYSARPSFYMTHVKMACSVMVSLGLVGTFLGLIDMIAGIAGALSNDEPDFAKKMQVLLGAISGSLSAMSFAFVTSILGVGFSAYSLVASTFVESHFKRNSNTPDFKNDSDKIIENRISMLESFTENLRIKELEVPLQNGAIMNILEEIYNNKDKSEIHLNTIIGKLDSINQHSESINNATLSNVETISVLIEKNDINGSILKEQLEKMNDINVSLERLLKKVDAGFERTDEIKKSVSSIKEYQNCTMNNLVSLLNIANEAKDSIGKHKRNLLSFLQ